MKITNGVIFVTIIIALMAAVVPGAFAQTIDQVFTGINTRVVCPLRNGGIMLFYGLALVAVVVGLIMKATSQVEGPKILKAAVGAAFLFAVIGGVLDAITPTQVSVNGQQRTISQVCNAS